MMPVVAVMMVQKEPGWGCRVVLANAPSSYSTDSESRTSRRWRTTAQCDGSATSPGCMREGYHSKYSMAGCRTRDRGEARPSTKYTPRTPDTTGPSSDRRPKIRHRFHKNGTDVSKITSDVDPVIWHVFAQDRTAWKSTMLIDVPTILTVLTTTRTRRLRSH